MSRNFHFKVSLYCSLIGLLLYSSRFVPNFKPGNVTVYTAHQVKGLFSKGIMAMRSNLGDKCLVTRQQSGK